MAAQSIATAYKKKARSFFRAYAISIEGRKIMRMFRGIQHHQATFAALDQWGQQEAPYSQKPVLIPFNALIVVGNPLACAKAQS